MQCNLSLSLEIYIYICKEKERLYYQASQAIVILQCKISVTFPVNYKVFKEIRWIQRWPMDQGLAVCAISDYEEVCRLHCHKHGYWWSSANVTDVWQLRFSSEKPRFSRNTATLTLSPSSLMPCCGTRGQPNRSLWAACHSLTHNVELMEVYRLSSVLHHS